jgi:hypothetical protein
MAAAIDGLDRLREGPPPPQDVRNMRSAYRQQEESHFHAT